MRTYHQVAQRDMWRIFNITLINLFTWRKGRASITLGTGIDHIHNIYQVNISLTRWENCRRQNLLVRTEEKFNWLISRLTVIPLSVYPSHWFRLSEEWFSTARLTIFPLKMEFGERKRRRKSQSFKLVTDEGRLLNKCKTLQDARLCLGVCLALCASGDDSVNKSDGQDNAHSLCLGV